MTSDHFLAAVALVLRHEGGFVNHPKDPGGATKYGITLQTLADWRQRAVSAKDVRALSLTEAKHIYFVRYWLAVGAHELPRGLDYVVFDAAVHSGVSRARKWLESLPDGLSISQQIETYMAQRDEFLRGLSTWKTFGRGWAKRLVEVKKNGLKFAKHAQQESEKNMTETKPWYLSKTIWSSVVTVVASLLGIFGFNISGDMANQAIDLIIMAITALSGMIALYGRVDAEKKLKF